MSTAKNKSWFYPTKGRFGWTIHCTWQGCVAVLLDFLISFAGTLAIIIAIPEDKAVILAPLFFTVANLPFMFWLWRAQTELKRVVEMENNQPGITGEQLEKLHETYRAGCISSEKYNRMRHEILNAPGEKEGKENMSPEKKQYWFAAKCYGWGWDLPCAWQGWVVFVAYIALATIGSIWITRIYSPAEAGPVAIVFLTILTALLIAICWVKGEPPRWRWGDKQDKKSSSPEDTETRLNSLKDLRQKGLITEEEYQTSRRKTLNDL